MYFCVKLKPLIKFKKSSFVTILSYVHQPVTTSVNVLLRTHSIISHTLRIVQKTTPSANVVVARMMLDGRRKEK